MSEEQRIDLYDDFDDAKVEANRRADETGADHYVVGHNALFTGAFWFKVTDINGGDKNRYAVSGTGIEGFRVSSPEGQTFWLRPVEEDSDNYLRLDDGSIYIHDEEDDSHAEEGRSSSDLIELLAVQYGMRVDLHWYQFTKVGFPDDVGYTYALWLNDVEVVSGALNPYEAFIALPKHIEDLIMENLLT